MSTPLHTSLYGQDLSGGSSTEQSVSSQTSSHIFQQIPISYQHSGPKSFLSSEPTPMQPYQSIPPSEYYTGSDYNGLNATISPSFPVTSLSTSVESSSQQEQLNQLHGFQSHSLTQQQVQLQQMPPFANPTMMYQQQPQSFSHPQQHTYKVQSNHLVVPTSLISKPHKHNLSNSTTSTGSLSSGSKSTHSRHSSESTILDYPDVVKPKIATTYWEDENTICYQVHGGKHLVSRREDNNYINGTKLLNVVNMTRGKRDGILKTEKTRTVVKVGSMPLKGVWIPFDRAYEIARNEGVDELLYPLFVKDLKTYYETKGYKLKMSADGKAYSPDSSPLESDLTIIGDTEEKSTS
ncbi:basic helix-loop-helix transcription factor [Scheffersomyces xylosifermentans]|uniref:basic helix-loop-helix transcription factor n=1 Tax=Scheffersomyces xylosifermentans TaxID=1304137 RepID=UPI00315D7A73